MSERLHYKTITWVRVVCYKGSVDLGQVDGLEIKSQEAPFLRIQSDGNGGFLRREGLRQLGICQNGAKEQLEGLYGDDPSIQLDFEEVKIADLSKFPGFRVE